MNGTKLKLPAMPRGGAIQVGRVFFNRPLWRIGILAKLRCAIAVAFAGGEAVKPVATCNRKRLQSDAFPCDSMGYTREAKTMHSPQKHRVSPAKETNAPAGNRTQI